MMSMLCTGATLWALAALVSTSAAYDVVVFGATGAGCTAAIAASRTGATVQLLSTTGHVGGMLTGGLQNTDMANQSVVQGITGEFFHRLGDFYYPGSGKAAWLFESHVGERVMIEMLQAANVSVVREVRGVKAVRRSGTTIQSFETVSGGTFAAAIFIDASYEGELAEHSATMVWGREGIVQYGELHAGRLGAESIGTSVSGYLKEGDPSSGVLPYLFDGEPVAEGAGDLWVESYDFRLCFTNSPGNQLKFTQPAGYNATQFEYWRRIYRENPPGSLAAAGLHAIGPVPNNYSDCGRPCKKYDMLGMNHGTDWTTGSWGYPNGTYAERQAIWRAHIDFTQALLWFWSSDEHVPKAVRDDIGQYGHCTDEYDATSDPPHWPHQLYVREAKRLVGDFVWTEYRPSRALSARTVGLGSYIFDCHYVSRYVDAATGQVVKEGRVKVDHQLNATRAGPHADLGMLMAEPFVMPYDTMLPKAAEATNLLVPVAVSSSHVRFNAVRLEPTWMILGHAAGAAAALCVQEGVLPHTVNVTQLQDLLVAQKQMLRP